MKCPKCNYVSFDYNETCPKCKKALSEVRKKMDYPSFKPSLPSISDFKTRAPTESIKMQQKTAVDLDDGNELEFSDNQDLDMQFDSGSAQNAEESGTELEFEEGSDELALDFDEFDMGDDAGKSSVSESSLETSLDLSFEEDSDELSFDFEESEGDNAASEAPQMAQGTSLEDSLEADLDRAFEEDPDGVSEDTNEKTVLLEPSEEAEVSAAFDMELDLSDDEAPEISIDLDDSFSAPKETASDADITFMDEGRLKSDPSELEVLDLDLDLEKSNK